MICTKAFEESPFAVTICDREGVILYMNAKSAQTFAACGGYELIGKNLTDCHPEPAKSKLLGLLGNHETNAYSIEKNGIKKLIYQVPWYENGDFGGYIELSLPLPAVLPHFIRT